MLKKYLYVSILLGAFILPGCADDERDNKEITEEVLPIPLNLTQEQKEEYYQEYVAVLDKVNAEDSGDFELELETITQFLDDNWIEVDDFEKLAKERANASIIFLKNKERYNPMSVPKVVKLQIGSKEANINFEGSFDTQLNSNTPKGRQLFSAFNSISSKAANADGSWQQYGHVALLKDSGVTYVIEVSGKYSQSGIISTHTMALKFNCDKNGGIK